MSPYSSTTVRTLDTWAATARLGYVVRSARGDELCITVGTDDTIHVEGVGSYEIVETVRVAERRAGLAARRAGHI